MTDNTSYEVGQRVATTINLVSMWPGGTEAPAGSLGTIASGLDTANQYGVVLDVDPDRMACGLTDSEICAL